MKTYQQLKDEYIDMRSKENDHSFHDNELEREKLEKMLYEKAVELIERFSMYATIEASRKIPPECIKLSFFKNNLIERALAYEPHEEPK